MSISTALLQQVPGTLASEQEIVVPYTHGELSCRCVSADSLAVSILNLCLQTSELDAASIDRLQQVSQELTNRITYLLEPIGPIEVDVDKCVVQLRSTPPAKEGDATSYYELLVQAGGSLSLVRYCQTEQPPREAIPATLTREVLARLADDMVAAVKV